MSRKRHRGRDLNGILLLDKPYGLSSNQALQRAKRLLQANKAGHTGSLDVRASGLLPLCFGEATKVSQYLLDADKCYLAEFLLGQQTSTGDSEGEVIAEATSTELSQSQVRAAMALFIGSVEQTPPMHSALKQGGQPLYKLARRGIEVERKLRRVHISRFDLLDFELPYIRVCVECSKGTYIRTLAEDLGAALGCGAHVTFLRRTGAGPFRIEQSLALDKLQTLHGLDDRELDRYLLSADRALGHLSAITLSANAASDLLCGRPVTDEFNETPGLVRIYSENLGFLGIGEVSDRQRLSARRLMRTDGIAGRDEIPRRNNGEPVNLNRKKRANSEHKSL